MQIKSYIEIYNIIDNSIRIVWEDTNLIEAPNWTRNNSLIVNSNGLLYRIDLNSGIKTQINTEFANCCNNDHGISPDGSQIVISHEDGDKSNPLAWQSSKIYILPIEGGMPRLVTKTDSSFWHGWSPDGEKLIYTALRNGQWDIYSIDVTGENETQLTNSQFQHDGSEYSPDGMYIYYNSYDSGYMEIWRMLANGTNHEQITNDKHSNWFPHFSADNKYMVYLCYLDDQKEAHPFGQRVILKIQDCKTKEISNIGNEFYGGQGTINVNSWSPDCKEFAYVRYNKID